MSLKLVFWQDKINTQHVTNCPPRCLQEKAAYCKALVNSKQHRRRADRGVSVKTSGMTVIGSVLAVFLMTGPADAQELTLKREGKDTYLVQGKTRLRIANPGKAPDAPDVFYLPDGDTVTLAGDSIQVRTKAGQTGAISLTETLKQWVHDDSKWGGHAFENFILGVYNNGGLNVSIGDTIVFNGALLAILTTQATRGSGNDLKSQQLVRVQTTPTIALQMLRVFTAPSTSTYSMPPAIPRLFLRGKSLLLFADPGDPDTYKALKSPQTAPTSQMEEIDRDGKTLRVAATFPSPLYPSSLIADRWLVLNMTLPLDKADVSPLWLHDMQRHVTLSLPVKRQEYRGYMSVYLPSAGSTMPYVALEPAHDEQGEDANGKAVRLRILHLPDGRRAATLPTPRQPADVLLWNGLVVVVEPRLRRIVVYTAQTGRRVKTLALNGGK